MIKATTLMALANKLQEEGVVGSTTDVEVSANVHVTPEEQTKIDEAVTQVEEIATAGQEIDETIDEQEQTEEAEATLRAIVNNLKKYGSLNNQMYSFLQETGYLDAIAAYQSTQMNKVVYPAVETIAPNQLNKAYMDSIIAGCEGMLANAAKRVGEFLKKIWEKIVSIVQRIVAFFTANEKNIEARKDEVAKITVDVSNAKYPGSYCTLDNMTTIASAVKSISPELVKAFNEFKNLKLMDKIKDVGAAMGGDEQAKSIRLAMSAIKEVGSNQYMISLKDLKIGGANTLGEAKLTTDALKNTAYQSAKECVGYAKSHGKLLNEIKSYASRMAKYAENVTQIANATDTKGNTYGEEYTKAVREFSGAYASAIGTVSKNVMLVARSYMVACAAALRRAGQGGDNNLPAVS